MPADVIRPRETRDRWLLLAPALLILMLGAVGPLAIVVVYFRNRGSIAVEDLNVMKG